MEQSTDTAEIEQLRADLGRVTARANRDSADLVRVQAERDALKAQLAEARAENERLRDVKRIVAGERDALKAAVERVREAHAEHPDPYITGFCRTCGKTDGPCETKRLLAEISSATPPAV